MNIDDYTEDGIRRLAIGVTIRACQDYKTGAMSKTKLKHFFEESPFFAILEIDPVSAMEAVEKRRIENEEKRRKKQNSEANSKKHCKESNKKQSSTNSGGQSKKEMDY
jgi:hypothetical protein